MLKDALGTSMERSVGGERGKDGEREGGRGGGCALTVAKCDGTDTNQYSLFRTFCALFI